MRKHHDHAPGCARAQAEWQTPCICWIERNHHGPYALAGCLVMAALVLASWIAVGLALWHAAG